MVQFLFGKHSYLLTTAISSPLRKYFYVIHFSLEIGESSVDMERIYLLILKPACTIVDLDD